MGKRLKRDSLSLSTTNRKFALEALDQFGNIFKNPPVTTWSVATAVERKSGPSRSTGQNGYFTAPRAGQYTVTGQVGDKQLSFGVQVQENAGLPTMYRTQAS